MNDALNDAKIWQAQQVYFLLFFDSLGSYLTLIWNAIVTLAFLYFILSTAYTIYSSKHLYKKKQSNETEYEILHQLIL